LQGKQILKHSKLIKDGINNINSKSIMSNNIFEKYKVLNSLRAGIDSIVSNTVDYLSTKFNQSKSVFTAASPFGQLLIVIENLTQLVFYYIEDSITELNINEATRATSIYSLASISGHNPSRAISSVGEVSMSIKLDVDEYPADLVIIPNTTRLTCENNGLTYILDLPQDEIKFSLLGRDNGLTFSIKQGILETQTVVARGVSLESFSIGSPQNFFIDQYYVNVYVNGEKWRKYESFLDIPKGEKGFYSKTGVTSGLDIYFGNESFGAMPNPGAEIIVEYLITEGPSGNIRTSDPSAIKFKFQETGFTLNGEEVELNDYVDITVTQPPFFGANPEDSALTKLIAPHTSKSFALVNPKHYEIALRKLGMFSTINVYLDELDSRMLNLFLIPDIRKTFANSVDYFSTSLDRFVLNDYQKSELLKYLEKTGSKLISTDIKIVNPEIKKYVINTTIIAFDDVPTELIKNDIYNQISSYFVKNTRKDRVPKSDLIKIIEEVKGVDSVSVSIIGEANEAAKKLNPNAASIGLDEFNDIITKDGELAIIRGGFTDRYGNEYKEGISEDSLGSLNIKIQDIIERPSIEI
jgi:hypothetical protein